MDINTIIFVTNNSCRLIFRSWLFRFFLIFSCLGIFGFQLLVQGNVSQFNISGLITMASFIPYMNLYVFVVLQAFFVIFLTGNFLTRERELDTMDVIHYRSESNVELLFGYYLGFIISFGLVALLSLFLGLCIHLFFSAAPFSMWTYIFYLLTFLVPSMVFYTGLSFFLFSIFRKQIVGLVILSFCLFINLYFADRIFSGILDPLGISLPNTLSVQVGHPNLFFYLVQRICWMMIGCLFLAMSIKFYFRIPNSTRALTSTSLLLLSLLVGIGCGFMCWKTKYDENKVREEYRDVYAKYRKAGYLTLVDEKIKLEHRGTTISCNCRLIVENRTGRELDKFVFYLNPSLMISSLKIRGKEVIFSREGQVIVVDERVDLEDRMSVEMEYAGGIDDRICYLDVPNAEYQDTRERSYLACRFGKRNIFLGKEYTLLLPECLWYPVTVPPVNHVYPFDISRQYTTFNLSVSGYGGRKVISQGKKNVYKDRVEFDSEKPVTGLSLCVGNYMQHAITVDGICYELYLFKSSNDVFRGLNHTDKFLSTTIRDLREKLEATMGRSFPYSRLRIVESPLSFTSYYRESQGGSGYVQPEMVFLPERGVGYCIDMRQEKKGENKKRVTIPANYGSIVIDKLSEMEIEQRLVGQMIEGIFLGKYHWNTSLFRRPKFNLFTLKWESQRGKYLEQELNDYYLSPMFYEQVYQVRSADYPVMDNIFLDMIKSESERVARKDFYRRDLLERKAINYLNGHSLAEAEIDSSLTKEVLEKILSLKTDDLFRRFAYYGLQPRELFSFIDSCTRELRFQVLDFDQISTRLKDNWDIDCKAILSDWYHQKLIPMYILKEFRVDKISDNKEYVNSEELLDLRRVVTSFSDDEIIFQVTLELYNDSDVDGIVSLVKRENANLFSNAYYSSDDLYYKNVMLAARSGKILKMLCNYIPTLDMGISNNYPLKIKNNLRFQLTDDVQESVSTAEKAYFLQRGEEDEIILDNEDPGFCMLQKRKFWFRDLLRGGKESDRDVYDYEPLGDDKNEWRVRVCEDAYGTPLRSSVYKLVGEGKSVISWNTHIPKSGNYEIYIHLPINGVSSSQIVERDPKSIINLKYIQYYRIKSESNVYSVDIDVRKNCIDFWASLGQFYLEEGKFSIELSDKGSEIDQIIQGDAVKIVYVGK